MHTGRRIKIVRVARGLTQEDLAAKINKTRPLVSHIEQTGKVNRHTLELILDALGIDEETLMRVDEEYIPYKHSKEIEAELRAEVARLKHINELLERENQALKKLVETQESVIRDLRRKKK